MIDAYKVADLEVREVSARVKLQRGMRQAFMRSISAAEPRPARPARARAGVAAGRARARGSRAPTACASRAGLSRGARRLTFVGTDADSGDAAFGDAITLILDDSGGRGRIPRR
jgi:hypothetical protein